MEAAQHTAGPWEARASRETDDFGIIAPDTSAEGGWVCLAECFSDIRRANEQALQEAAANARRIVQCVNAHDDLLVALRPFAHWASGFGPYGREDSWVIATTPSGKTLTMGDVRRAHTALAKATGSAA